MPEIHYASQPFTVINSLEVYVPPPIWFICTDDNVNPLAMLSDEFERNPVCTHLKSVGRLCVSIVAFGRPGGLRLNVSQDCVLTVDVFKLMARKMKRVQTLGLTAKTNFWNYADH